MSSQQINNTFEGAGGPQREVSPNKDEWLDMAQEAFLTSTSYVDNNYRRKWEDGIKHFQSEHATGSKYTKSQYMYRSKIFRPKTRSAIRNNEAACASAFFSNQDVVAIEPEDPNNPAQEASAAIVEELLNYRLQKTIPWFLTVIGGFQDAQKVGVVCSYQYWDYQEIIETFEMPLPDGTTRDVKVPKVVKDEPVIELMPVENVRIHPAANWIDPVGSSPYLIRMVPMHVQDVRARMENEDPKTGQPKWKTLSDEQITAARRNTYDSTRQAREGRREEKYDPEATPVLSDYDTVWCHENFMMHEGVDYVFWTLGVEHRLTDPKPIEEVYWTGERPVVIGNCIIETHKLYPSSVSEIGSNLQKEINENVNQRMDNVKLVMNKRFVTRRGANVDLASLVRNVPGGVTQADDIAGDIRELEFNDVTGSSFQEQDRLNADYDGLVGTFSASSINTNRKLNETVGGMNMLRGATNSLVEFLIRMFSETWVEPVLRQLTKMEQKYETDMVVLSMAAGKAQLLQRYGIDQVTDELLNQELTLSVNVGTGATDPVQKMQQFMMGIQSVTQVAQVAATLPGVFDIAEISKEIFGRIGYKDGARFLLFDEQDPVQAQLQQQIQQAAQQIAQLQAALNEKQSDRQLKVVDTQMKEQGQDRRKGAELETRLMEKRMDLLNPVSGELEARRQAG